MSVDPIFIAFIVIVLIFLMSILWIHTNQWEQMLRLYEREVECMEGKK